VFSFLARGPEVREQVILKACDELARFSDRCWLDLYRVGDLLEFDLSAAFELARGLQDEPDGGSSHCLRLLALNNLQTRHVVRCGLASVDDIYGQLKRIARMLRHFRSEETRLVLREQELDLFIALANLSLRALAEGQDFLNRLVTVSQAGSDKYHGGDASILRAPFKRPQVHDLLVKLVGFLDCG